MSMYDQGTRLIQSFSSVNSLDTAQINSSKNYRILIIKSSSRGEMSHSTKRRCTMIEMGPMENLQSLQQNHLGTSYALVVQSIMYVMIYIRPNIAH